MKPIRVLITDDAVVVRRMLSDVLAQDPDIEVVGTASNGRMALAKLALTQVDVVVLDVEMPELDGLETLVAMRDGGMKVAVIMFSTLTERGAVTTIEALSRGATDYVTKPSGTRSQEEAMASIRAELIPKIKAAAGRSHRPTMPPVQPLPSARPAPELRPARVAGLGLDILAIGASTGGPNALSTVLSAFEHNFPIPIVVVQHMPPVFTKYLAERLDTACQLSVKEAADGDKVEPGRVLIAPGSFHMKLERRAGSVVAALDESPPENSCRPAVDVLFRSVASVYGAGALVAVLTGMGQDGLRGAQQIIAAGGRVFVQDEATSVVWGMPGFIARANIAEKILPIDRMAGELRDAATRDTRSRAAGGRA